MAFCVLPASETEMGDLVFGSSDVGVWLIGLVGWKSVEKVVVARWALAGAVLRYSSGLLVFHGF